MHSTSSDLTHPDSIHTDTVYPLVLLGGGHSHVLWLTYWQQINRDDALKDIRPLLVSENTNSPYSGMLPSLLSGACHYNDCHIDLVRLCQNSDCDFLQRTCINITAVEHACYETLYRLDFLSTDQKPSFIYCEKLSINIGSQPTPLLTESDNKPGSNTCWKVKPISQFYNNWLTLQAALIAPEAGTASPTISIIGAGAAGIEIACAIKLAQSDCHIQLIATSKTPLPSFSAKIQQRCLQRLNTLGIKFIGETTATDNTTDFTLLCTPSAAPLWLKNSDLSLSDAGFIAVDEHLQTSLPGVFAAGDCIHFSPSPLAKAGVYAVRQASTLFLNTCSSAKPLARFRPQTSFLSIINMGNHYALAQKGRWSLTGYWPWRYKQYLDRKFMAQFK